MLNLHDLIYCELFGLFQRNLMPYLFFAQQIFLDGLAKRKGISQKIAIFPFLAQNK